MEKNKPKLISFRGGEALEIIYEILDSLKKSRVIEPTRSANSFLTELLSSALINKETKIIDSKGTNKTLWEQDGIEKIIYKNIEKKANQIKQLFLRDNHLSIDKNSLVSSGVLTSFSSIQGIIIELENAEEGTDFYINYDVLRMVLSTYIDLKDVDIITHSENLVIDYLANEMCKYVQIGNEIKESNEEKHKSERYYKFESYIPPISKDDYIKIVMYENQNKDGFVKIQYEINIKGVNLEQSVEIDVDLGTQEDVFNYISDVLGFDIRRMPIKVETTEHCGS